MKKIFSETITTFSLLLLVLAILTGFPGCSSSVKEVTTRDTEKNNDIINLPGEDTTEGESENPSDTLEGDNSNSGDDTIVLPDDMTDISVTDNVGVDEGHDIEIPKDEGTADNIIDTGYDTGGEDNGQVVDSTPPVGPTAVRDSTGSDIDTQTGTNCLSANWDAATDHESGIDHYEIAFGTAAGKDDIVKFKNVGDVLDYTECSLSLTQGKTYYANVRAVNGAGLVGNTVSSDGVTVIAPNIKDDASVYFSFNDSSSLGRDDSGKGNNAVLHNVTYNSKSRHGSGAAHFNGNSYMELTGQNDLFSGNSGTVMFWARAESGSRDGVLFELSDSGGDNSLKIVWSSSKETVFVYLSKNGQDVVPEDPSGWPPQNRMGSIGDAKTGHWVFVAMASDGKVLRAYLDGIEWIVGEESTWTSHINISRARIGEGFSGDIDEFRYYSREVSRPQLLELMHNNILVNQAPRINIGPDMTIPVKSLKLNAQISDDGLGTAPLSLKWSAPSGVTFSSDTIPNPVVSFPGNGTYLLNLKADDGEKQTVESVRITVNQGVSSITHETRGILITTLDDSWFRSKTEIEKLIDYIANANFNVIYPLIYDDGALLWYHSDKYPDRVTNKTFDTLDYLMERAHSKGIEVHAWFIVGRPQGNIPSDWLAIAPDGKPYGSSSGEAGGTACYHKPNAYLDFIKDIASEMATKYKGKLDGLIFDYIRLVETSDNKLNHCYCNYCKNKFKQIYGVEITEASNWMLNQWEVDTLTNFLKDVVVTVKAIDPDIVVSTSTWPGTNRFIGQDPTVWANEAGVENLLSMIYLQGPADEDNKKLITADFLRYTNGLYRESIYNKATKYWESSDPNDLTSQMNYSRSIGIIHLTIFDAFFIRIAAPNVYDTISNFLKPKVPPTYPFNRRGWFNKANNP